MNHDELEWQAQEQARLDLRRGAGERDESDAQRDYRTIARALRSAPMVTLPADFAHLLALRVEAGGAVELDMRLEQWLTRALGTALAVGTVASAWRYGGDWLQASAPLLAGTAPVLGWGLVIAACAAVTWLGSRLEPDHGSR